MMGENEEQGFGRFNKVVYEDKSKAKKKPKKKNPKNQNENKPSQNIPSKNMNNSNTRKSDFFGSNQFNNSFNQNISSQNNNNNNNNINKNNNYIGPKLNNLDFNSVVNYDEIKKIDKTKEFEKAIDDAPVDGDIDNDNYTIDYNAFLNNPLRDKEDTSSEEETSFGELMNTVSEDASVPSKKENIEEKAEEKTETEIEEETETDQDDIIKFNENDFSNQETDDLPESNILVINTNDYQNKELEDAKSEIEEKEDDANESDDIIRDDYKEIEDKSDDITIPLFEVNDNGTIKFNEQENEDDEQDIITTPFVSNYENNNKDMFFINNFIDDKYNNGIITVVEEKKKKPWIIFLIIFLLLLLIGLGIYLYINFWAKPSLNSVDLTDVSIIYVGEDEDILAKAKGIGNLSNTIFTYTLSNNEIITLKNYDDIKGRQAENTLIPTETGKFILYLRAKFKKQVVNLERQIVICKRLSKDSISTDKITITVGHSNQIYIDLGDPLCSKDIKFSDYNKKIISVSEDGTITGLGKGETEITVKIGDDLVTIPVEIIEEDAENPNIPLKGITFLEKSITISVGDKKKLDVTFNPNNATNKNLNWTSANTSLVTVDKNGVITGVKKGTTTVTAKSIDGSHTAIITVNVVEVTTAGKISPTKITTYVNGIKKKYAKGGDTITIVVEFDEEITTKPQIEIAGIVAQVANGTTSFSASIVLNSNVKDGEIPVRISNYKSKSGKIGVTITEFYPSIAIADNTPPTCSFELIGDDVMITGSDANGIAGYLVDNNSTASSSSAFSSIRIYPVTSGKTYYGHVIDNAGNINTNGCKITIN